MKASFSKNTLFLIAFDMLILCSAFYLSHQIRFDFLTPDWAMRRFFQILPYVLAIKVISFIVFDVYKGMWRYTSLNDIITLIKSSSVSTLILIVFILFTTRFEMVSRSVFIIDWCLSLIFIVSSRVITRICFEQFSGRVRFEEIIHALMKIFTKQHLKGKKVIIIGAGDCGQKICREFIENPAVQSHVVGFLDDDTHKIGRKIHGIPVLSNIDDLESAAASMDVNDVVIAIPSAGTEKIRQIVDLCQHAEINHKIVPDMGELVDGKIDLSAIRNVEYRDLLGRGQVKLDRQTIGEYLGGKVVLVTGAGGSIGTGLCRQICRYAPEKIILFERAESPLFEIEHELKRGFINLEIIPVLGDIQDKTELFKIFEIYQPQIVFHAAAYKHVPMLEQYPWKAIENNIKGTDNLLWAAREFKVEKFVFVSTDKAVNPTSVMGTSKRIAELMVQQHHGMEGATTSFMTVRFGNVIGSVGSVIPLFKRQIQEGGPVTITHPDITRFFMLIPEACQLILQAGAMGQGGEIFILEMGQPVKIDTMARDLIRFSGLEPEKDIKIEYTGLRPGEKLYEELMTDQENIISTAHQKIMVLNSTSQNRMLDGEQVQILGKIAQSRDHEKIREVLKEIVPEYTPMAKA
ncbi:MAG: polysaccharide biosynthesis protein [Desulfobacteraceae bacterium]|nr:MAG: polysaccharide biosynthesis protein [Desulfobacteraceae bacterium]